MSETERIHRLSVDVTGAQLFARQVAARLSELGDPDAGEAAHMLEELTALSGALHEVSEPPESPAIVSRLMCISARCDGPLVDLGKLVDKAAVGETAVDEPAVGTSAVKPSARPPLL